MILCALRRRVLTDNAFDASLVLGAVLLEHIICLGLSWRLRVGIVEKVLDTQEDLLDGDGWLPGLFLVQNRQAHCT